MRVNQTYTSYTKKGCVYPFAVLVGAIKNGIRAMYPPKPLPIDLTWQDTITIQPGLNGQIEIKVTLPDIPASKNRLTNATLVFKTDPSQPYQELRIESDQKGTCIGYRHLSKGQWVVLSCQQAVHALTHIPFTRLDIEKYYTSPLRLPCTLRPAATTSPHPDPHDHAREQPVITSAKPSDYPTHLPPVLSDLADHRAMV